MKRNFILYATMRQVAKCTIDIPDDVAEADIGQWIRENYFFEEGADLPWEDEPNGWEMTGFEQETEQL